MTRVKTRSRSHLGLGETLLTATLMWIYLGSRGAAQALGVAQRFVPPPQGQSQLGP